MFLNCNLDIKVWSLIIEIFENILPVVNILFLYENYSYSYNIFDMNIRNFKSNNIFDSALIELYFKI